MPARDRAFRLSRMALWMGFGIVVIAAALCLAGKMTPEFVQVAGGFGLVASVALGGVHWTNVQERKAPTPEPPL